MRKLALVLAILALLLAALVGLLTWQFSGLVTPRLESYLAAHGVDALATSEVQWRFNRLRIQDLRASGAVDDIPFDLQLERVDVGYQWWRLFNGTIDRVTVGHAKLNLDLSVDRDERAPAELAIAPLLPQAWLASLPVSTLLVRDLSATLRLPDQRLLGITGSHWRLAGDDLDAALTLRELEGADGSPAADSLLAMVEVASRRDSPLALSVAISSAGRLVANLALSLSPSTPQVHTSDESLQLTLRGEADHANLVAALETLAAAGHSLAMPMAELPPVSGQSRLRLALSLPARVSGELIDWLLDAGIAGSARHRLAWPDPNLGEVRAQLRYRLAGTPRALELHVDRPLVVEGEVPGLGDALPESFVDWRQGAPFHLEVLPGEPVLLRGADLSLASATARLNLGPEGQHLAVEAEATDLTVSDGAIAARLDAEAILHRHAQPLLAPRLRGTVSQREGAWTLAGEVDEARIGMRGQWWASLAADGGYQLSLDGRAGDLPRLLETAGAILPLDLPLALTEGTGQLRYRLDRNMDGVSGEPLTATQRLGFNVAGMAGLLRGFALEQVSIEGELVEAGHWQSAGDIHLRVGHLNAGVRVDGIDARVRLMPSPSLEQTIWTVASFEARLFGGDARLEAPFAVRVPITATAFNLVLSDWQLSEIFALYADHGLSGSGVLSGRLPVLLGPEGLTIQGGELASQQPGGTIVYDGGAAGNAVASGNQQLDIALRLLRNFQYDTLAARASFVPSGDLMLGLNLAGRNPDEFGGQAVNFNINVEENLFNLLRALQLTDDVIRRLEDRLRR